MKVKGKGKGAEGGEGCSLLIGESEFGNGGGEEGKRARGAKFGAFRHFFFHFKHRTQFLHSRTAGKLTWRLTQNTPKLLVAGASCRTHWRNLQHFPRPPSWWVGGLPPLPENPTLAQPFALRAHLAPQCRFRSHATDAKHFIITTTSTIIIYPTGCVSFIAVSCRIQCISV